MQFVSSYLPMSISRYVWLTTSTENHLCATFRERVLLSLNIFSIGVGAKWHQYLTDGWFVFCGWKEKGDS